MSISIPLHFTVSCVCRQVSVKSCLTLDIRYLSSYFYIPYVSHVNLQVAENMRRLKSALTLKYLGNSTNFQMITNFIIELSNLLGRFNFVWII